MRGEHVTTHDQALPSACEIRENSNIHARGAIMDLGGRPLVVIIAQGRRRL